MLAKLLASDLSLVAWTMSSGIGGFAQLLAALPPARQRRWELVPVPDPAHIGSSAQFRHLIGCAQNLSTER